MVIMVDQRFPKSLRLRTRGDFRRVYERKSWAGDSTMRMAAARSDLPHPRLGLSVGRVVGNAVRRNRWKRLIREAFRTSRERMPAGLDLIVVPRNDIEPELRRIAESLVSLAWRLHKRLKTNESRARRQNAEESGVRSQESESGNS